MNKEIVGKVVLKYPHSLSEQTAIATILSDCDKEISSLEEKRDKYKELKQGMMQQLAAPQKVDTERWKTDGK